MRDYKDTLNLPSTGFPMRANLTIKEPEISKKWEGQNLYFLMQKKAEGLPPFVLHDGPPFSNGSIHMGTALNKILKDFIVKSKSMAGFRSPYRPGWDNHGMPIESAIIKKNKLDRKKMSIPDFRKACGEFASHFVDVQRLSFKRLGVFGDWENPYLTMDPSFESREVKVFGELYKQRFIYKGLKPVYWCPKDETALAEAEIEYGETPSASVYVKFKLSNDNGKLKNVAEKNGIYFIIWTTTPWTLPGNMAIALHPREDYSLVRAGGSVYIVAEELVGEVFSKGGIEDYEVIGKEKGSFFENMTASHPFLDRNSLICLADYVTTDSGTGCVHTAPGFGGDDYHTGVKYSLEIVVPVDDRGYQTKDAGPFAGMFYEESNSAIIKYLEDTGALFSSSAITHQYPHCWRCKNPIIFRATPQWFISVSAFRDKAIAASKEVEWLPGWGGERMISMIKERSDWCISRQRHWGLPIPVFYCEDCGEIICEDKTIEHISKIFGEEGSNAWFTRETGELLPGGYFCPKCGGGSFKKETDTLDGWFDSGSTHFAVLEGDENMTWPAAMYLEGADQYRGWFQSSLLTAVGAKDSGAPYRQVLTHGWVVDGEGKAMHKSAGNSMAPEEVIGKYGADMLRLWVAASDYRVDVRASDEIFKQLSESYRKIRNTLRILLANLGDKNNFDPETDMVPFGKLGPIDKWLLNGLDSLVKTVDKAYRNYEFHIVYHEIHNFCSINLSKIYIDITKDRVYCEKSNSLSRRRVQTVMYTSLSCLVRMLAPILSFTAEEAWGSMSHAGGDDKESVFLNLLPGYDGAVLTEENAVPEDYDKLFEYRDAVLKALEEARAAKIIGKPLDADVVIYGDKNLDAIKVFGSHSETLSDIFITSRAKISHGTPPENSFYDESTGIYVLVKPASGEKCARCWKSVDVFVEDGGGQHLCERCALAVR
ncbi:MAG: isoleucine--tRNA ligase [Eubacteriales bacterium]